MQQFNIHRVKSVSAESVNIFSATARKKIIVETEEGSWIEINLFSECADNLFVLGLESVKGEG